MNHIPNLRNQTVVTSSLLSDGAGRQGFELLSADLKDLHRVAHDNGIPANQFSPFDSHGENRPKYLIDAAKRFQLIQEGKVIAISTIDHRLPPMRERIARQLEKNPSLANPRGVLV